MKTVKVVGAVRRRPGDWVASRSVFEVRLDQSGYDHVMNVALALSLGIRAGWQGTLCAVPDGEKVPRAELALRETHEIQARNIAYWKGFDEGRKSARAELALREPEMIVEISESGKIISTIQRLTTESEGLRAGHYAIREIPDAPKPKVKVWRRPCFGHSHEYPYECGRCGCLLRAKELVRPCSRCNAGFEGVASDLPGAEE